MSHVPLVGAGKLSRVKTLVGLHHDQALGGGQFDQPSQQVQQVVGPLDKQVIRRAAKYNPGIAGPVGRLGGELSPPKERIRSNDLRVLLDGDDSALEEARQHLEIAVQIDPSHSDAYNWLER